MVAALIKGLMAFGTKLFMSVASEKMIEWMFFYLSQQIVANTKTKHDDKFLVEVKKAFYK